MEQRHTGKPYRGRACKDAAHLGFELRASGHDGRVLSSCDVAGELIVKGRQLAEEYREVVLFEVVMVAKWPAKFKRGAKTNVVTRYRLMLWRDGKAELG